ncbi:MAG TPA: divalent-cation tolerance protein CutA [Desulfomonilia bacterium]
MELSFVYITASNVAEAEKIGSMLVEKRLAACVNIFEKMTSIYRWEGKVHKEEETVIIAKTRTGLIDELTAKVRELHSYTVPCIVSLPVAGGNPDFLNWIENETKP